jgi:hypothetical protein
MDFNKISETVISSVITFAVIFGIFYIILRYHGINSDDYLRNYSKKPVNQ